MRRKSPLTFEELCDLEPGLSELATEASSIRDDGQSKSFCANRVWYVQGMRNRLIQLVGFQARHSDTLMRTSDAYDVAYDAIYGLLPDCRSCSCLNVEALFSGVKE